MLWIFIIDNQSFNTNIKFIDIFVPDNDIYVCLFCDDAEMMPFLLSSSRQIQFLNKYFNIFLWMKD